jgi:hypothetical protein
MREWQTACERLRAGYRMHISKPVELAELVTVMASLVGRSDKVE